MRTTDANRDAGRVLPIVGRRTRAYRSNAAATSPKRRGLVAALRATGHGSWQALHRKRCRRRAGRGAPARGPAVAARASSERARRHL